MPMDRSSSRKLFFQYQKYILPYWRKASLSLLVSTVALLLGMLTPLITRALIDYAYPNRDVRLLTFLIVGGVVIFFLQQFFESISGYLDMYAENDLSVKLKSRFYDRLQRFSMKFHGSRQTGDLMYRLTNDVESVVSMVIQFIAVSLQTFCQLGFLLAICLLFDWRLTLLALSGVPLYLLETQFFAKKREKIIEKELAQDSEVTSFLQERIPAIKMIKTFNREEEESRTFHRKMKKIFHIARQGHIIEFLNTFTDSTIKTVWLAILGWYAGYHVITGVLTIGEVVAVSLYIAQIYGPVLNLGDVYKFAVEGMVSVRRVDEVLSRGEGREEPSGGKELNNVCGSIEFQNLAFSYTGTDSVLNGVSLKIDKGQNIALVGPSGVGKTTLTDLLMRFYEPTSGKIFVDGENIAGLRVGCLRKHIGAVSQETTLFRGTIKENICYGNTGASDNDVVLSAKQANAHEFIEGLPDGYDTRLEEGGLNLSGGQRQRITIARALIRNPVVLILDEATSSVDPESEAYIHNALMHLRGEKTVLSIAHRLSTIMGADEVVYLSGGRVVEKGSFKDLMDRRGAFFEFYEKEYGNFHFFMERLHREVIRSRRYKRPLSLIMLEIKNIGKVTQGIGEEMVDELYEEMTRLIHKKVRNVDFVTKYQKERFLLCFPETSFESTALAVKRLREILDTHLYLEGSQDVRLQTEVGVANLQKSITIEALFRGCEKMLEGRTAHS